MKSTLAVTCFLFAGALLAQDAPVYRLNFALREMEAGKIVNTRNYTLLALSQSNTKLNIGAKIPIASGANHAQYSYVDVGVSVRAQVRERGSLLQLNANLEVSNLGADRENADRPAPRIQQLRAEIDTVITPGQATPVVTLDDPLGSRHYEVEVTATKTK
jgi:hypothetical protein